MMQLYTKDQMQKKLRAIGHRTKSKNNTAKSAVKCTDKKNVEIFKRENE